MHIFVNKKRKRNCKTFYIQKSRHFAKINTIYVTFFKPKSNIIYIPQFFMKILNLKFIYKKHDTLLYVMFLYTKIHTLLKIKTICGPFLCTKIRRLCATHFFIEPQKLAEEKGKFLFLKKALCVKFV